MKRSVLFVTLAALLVSAAPGFSQSGAPSRVVREMNAVQQELLRRDPNAQAYGGYDAGQVDAGASRLARSMSDAQLIQAMAAYVRMTGVRSLAAGGGPAPSPATPKLAPPPAVSGSTLVKGQAVQVLWQGSWYPGRVLETDGPRTKVRYDGWSSSWDEWVAADRLRPAGAVAIADPVPSARPAPTHVASPAQSKPAGKHEAHCKPFWAEARKDCFLRDRESFSCPIIAANKYEQCLKTGRW